MTLSSCPRPSRRLATLAMAAFLSGCLTSDNATTPKATVSVQSQPAAIERAAPRAPQTAARTPAMADWTLDDLSNATPEAVTGLLGTPAFVRTEPPAAYWRFGDATCALDVYLYAEDGGPARVRHAEVRRQSAGDALGCLEHLRRTLVAETVDAG